MRKNKKIKIIFNQTSYNKLSLFWTLIEKESETNEKKYFNFYRVLHFHIEKNKIKINKNVINSLKPFIKISKIFIKNNNIVMNNQKSLLDKKRLKTIKKYY